jgi:hypothetical protein
MSLLAVVLISAGGFLLAADAASAQLPDLPSLLGDDSTTTTGDGTDDEPGTTAPTGGRQTTITNQFNSATGGSISERRPGIWIQQGIAVHNGDTSFFTGVPEDEPGFFRDTFNQIFTQLATIIQDMLTGLNLLITSSSGNTTPGGTAWVPIPNAATSGQGQRVTIQ